MATLALMLMQVLIGLSQLVMEDPSWWLYLLTLIGWT